MCSDLFPTEEEELDTPEEGNGDRKEDIPGAFSQRLIDFFHLQ